MSLALQARLVAIQARIFHWHGQLTWATGMHDPPTSDYSAHIGEAQMALLQLACEAEGIAEEAK